MKKGFLSLPSAWRVTVPKTKYFKDPEEYINKRNLPFPGVSIQLPIHIANNTCYTLAIVFPGKPVGK